MRALILLLLATSLQAQSIAVAPAPIELYTLRSLAWDSPGATNWQVLVRTQTNALPVSVFEVQQRQAAVSNLQYNVTYWLSVKAQSNGLWSAESVFYRWPHPQTNYVTTVNQTAASILGTWTDVPSSLRTEINPPYVGAVWRLAIFESNNINPFIVPQN